LSDQSLPLEYKVNVTMKHFNVSVPAQSEPAWAPLVARWHQLDEATYAVVEAAFRYGNEFPEEWDRVRPHSIWIAAAGGSNPADYDFVLHGSRSPSRFVGTLPSIRSSSLSLLMNWRGPVMCLQQGKETMLRGFEEIYWHLLASQSEPSWLITTTKTLEGQQTIYKVSFFCFGSDADSEFLFSKDPSARGDVFMSHLNLAGLCDTRETKRIDIGLGLTFVRKN
jgi:hypothetical protein